ncbi:hypothetical protein TSUD_288170 [Trifolium subterraneum]|uniref:BED-type domain-containing protein n=1 Tax=Trifolium subterraneum TaxID=3900 RepID=A0A2Z6PCF4_TRISU|nr:hypothetical protein TSUD_288170 [Trifolium subterraneum]
MASSSVLVESTVADLDKKKRRKQVLKEVRAQAGNDVHHDVAEVRGTQNGKKPAETSLQTGKKKRDRMSKMSAEEWKAYLLAARQKNTQPSTANTGQQLILHTHGEGNKGGKSKEKVKIGKITLLVPSFPSKPNEGVDVTSSTVMPTDNLDADSPPIDKDVPLPKRAKTGKDKSKKKRIVSSKGPTKSSEAVAPPSGGPSKPSAAASGAAVCSTTTNSLWDSSFNPVNFVEDKLKSAEDIDRIQSLSIEEARNLMLSYGLKAMLVGNVVTERQAKDLQAAQSKLTIADETLVEVQTKLEEVTENFKKEAKARAELEDKRKEDIEKLKKDHEDEIKKTKGDVDGTFKKLKIQLVSGSKGYNDAYTCNFLAILQAPSPFNPQRHHQASVSAMASSSAFESTVVKATRDKNDLAWRYNHMKDLNNKNQVTCNFCLLTSSAGITRARRHQLGIPGDVAACSKTPPDVKVLLQADLDKKKRRKQELEEVRAQAGDDVHHYVAEIRGTRTGKKPSEHSLQAAKKKKDRMSKMSAEEWKANLLAARQKNTQPSTANTSQQQILHTHGEGNKDGKRKEKLIIRRITPLVPSCQSKPNEGVDVTSYPVMAIDNPDHDSPTNDEDVPLPKRAKTGKDKSKKMWAAIAQEVVVEDVKEIEVVVEENEVGDNENYVKRRI